MIEFIIGIAVGIFFDEFLTNKMKLKNKPIVEEDENIKSKNDRLQEDFDKMMDYSFEEAINSFKKE